MDERRRPAHRVLRLSDGSAIVEGLVAVGTAFLLLALVVHVGFLLAAREVAAAAAEAAARRAAREGTDLAEAARRFEEELARALPGAEPETVTIVVDGDVVVATATFTWHPPGPRLSPSTLVVRATAARSAPP